MENTGTCSLAQRLCKLKLSINSKEDFLSILFFLRALISDLITNPLDGKYKTIQKTETTALCYLVSCEDIKELFLLLGYREEEGQFTHYTSDQNMTILEGCLDLLECFEKNAESPTVSEVSDIEHGENISQLQQSGQRSKSDSAVCEESKKQDKSFSGKLKNFFVMKHQKKECSGFFSFLKSEPKKKTPEIAYNSNGYFHQSCNKRGKSNQNDAMKDLFHTQERNKKKWGFC